MNNNSNTNNSKPTFKSVTMTLSREAVEFLSGTTSNVCHGDIFLALVKGMTSETTSFKKRGIDVPLQPGQTEARANSLGLRYGFGRKVIACSMICANSD